MHQQLTAWHRARPTAIPPALQACSVLHAPCSGRRRSAAPRRARAQLLATALPFSEAELVAENRGYLLRVLGLDALEVRGASAEAAAAAGRPQLAGAQPGAPVVHFLAPGA